MKKGKVFTRDYEFTGCCDAQIGTKSNLLNYMKNIGSGPTIRSSSLQFPSVQGFMEAVKEKSITVDLTDEQKATLNTVTGDPVSQLQVSVTPAEKSVTIKLNADQQKAIQDALGIEMDSLDVNREPVETNLK